MGEHKVKEVRIGFLSEGVAMIGIDIDDKYGPTFTAIGKSEAREIARLLLEWAGEEVTDA